MKKRSKQKTMKRRSPFNCARCQKACDYIHDTWVSLASGEDICYECYINSFK